MNPQMSEDLIFDVGLHRGEDAAYYLRKGFRVVGIDANPDLVAQARQRFSSAPGIEVINGAIESGSGTVTFYVDENSVWGTTDADWAARNRRLGSSQKMITVPIIDIRSLFQKHGVPYYLKLDIEGRERIILSAMDGLPQKPKFLSMESEKISFKQLVSDMRKLRALGYRRFKVVQQRDIPRSSIETVTRQGRPLSYTFEPDASGAFGDDLPGRWMSLSGAITKYAAIFVLYKLFGDYGLAFKVKGGERVYSFLMRLSGRRFPGWHDVHARLD